MQHSDTYDDESQRILDAQDAISYTSKTIPLQLQDLVTLKEVSELFGYHRSYYGVNKKRWREHEEVPFPTPIKDKYYRLQDIIIWEELKKQFFAKRHEMYLEREYQRKLAGKKNRYDYYMERRQAENNDNS